MEKLKNEINKYLFKKELNTLFKVSDRIFGEQKEIKLKYIYRYIGFSIIDDINSIAIDNGYKTVIGSDLKDSHIIITVYNI